MPHWGKQSDPVEYGMRNAVAINPICLMNKAILTRATAERTDDVDYP
jgi:hypothetical protein